MSLLMSHRPTSSPSPRIAESLRGCETILLVEDEDSLRRIMSHLLTKYGYKVLPARHGGEALEICASASESIDVVVTDVLMPEMGGRELIDRLTALHGREPLAILVSGYPQDDLSHQGVVDDRTPFLQKPVTAASLVQAIRDLLDRSRAQLPA